MGIYDKKGISFQVFWNLTMLNVLCFRKFPIFAVLQQATLKLYSITGQ